MAKDPYWFQSEAVASFWDYYQNGPALNSLIALPTGTGKSLVQAIIIKSIFQQYPNQRILGLTHVKDLISQNYDELLEEWPTAPVGICSAGLKQEDVLQPVVYGGVQTVVNRVDQIGFRDLLFIDEAHLVGPKSEARYNQVITGLKHINPKLKIIGLGATLWRLGLGHLVEGGLFNDVIYDMTSYENFNKLFAGGFLVPPIAPTRLAGQELTQYDLSGVHIDGWQYNERELDAATNTDSLNHKVCAEMCQMAYDRVCWMVFASSVDHAERLNAILRQYGIDSDVVHTDRKVHDKHGRHRNHNANTIAAWKAGRLRVIVNKDMLTTGINNRDCDFIGCCRGIISSSLWGQILGRGTRTSLTRFKPNCLIGDFAGNTKRLGPINDLVLPRKPGKGAKTGSIPIRICDSCGVYNSARAIVCTACGALFPVSTRLVEAPSEIPLVRTDEPIIVTHTVKHIVYSPHAKEGRPMCMRVSYYCGNQGAVQIDDWVHFEGKGLAKHKARDWWRQRTSVAPPETTTQALQLVINLAVPREIDVNTNTKYPEIKGVRF